VDVEIMLRVDGVEHRLVVDTRTTLLDALRERLRITSAKKGCDHGQCGAWTSPREVDTGAMRPWSMVAG
jgi:xanthine dehydrogenase YagT iron-sulfur-binding subunit